MRNPENEGSVDSIVAKSRGKKRRWDELLDDLIAEYGRARTGAARGADQSPQRQGGEDGAYGPGPDHGGGYLAIARAASSRS